MVILKTVGRWTILLANTSDSKFSTEVKHCSIFHIFVYYDLVQYFSMFLFECYSGNSDSHNDIETAQSHIISQFLKVHCHGFGWY